MSNERLETRILAYNDGELPEPEAAAVEADLANDEAMQQRVAFDRALRDRVGAVMSTGAAPAGLADLIRERLAEDGPEPVGRIDATTAEPEVVVRPRFSWSAVAAVVILIGGAVLAGILLPQIDEWPRSAPNADQFLVEVTQTIETEHERCAHHAERQAKIPWTTASAALEGIADRLGRPVELLDYSQHGFEFVGAGPCDIPGTTGGLHLLYVRTADPGQQKAMLSVFVMPHHQVFDAIQEISPENMPGCHRKVRVITNGSLAYLICCCDPSVVGDVSDCASKGYGCRKHAAKP